MHPPAAPRRATLFVTCIVDQVYPTIGQASVHLLERQGVEVRLPKGITCCGQMAFNAGFRDESYAIAARTIEVLRGQGDVVLPSGSCAAMIRHLYAELFAHSPYAGPAAELAGRTYELTEYLVDVLGVQQVGARYDGRIAYHDACHGLRFLGLGDQARTLLNAVNGAELRPLDGCTECCGFGGLFAVKQAAISEAMLARKLSQISASGADLIVTGDASCMTQINGGLSRQDQSVRTRHIAELLANMV
ncbi:MAG: (Fe-S)-binding protein [Candidatus Viridilinea halotolerans]|uniref:(Fe-S)-binding protein n=1 Tax=Candidatus Viridilinea halotolerans TaxID=2491704 RepID=A0A426TZ68_9CHLR|nr:MAG: (Fe-S)-binding protein [Candidatus Viridilinea halotolerans]